MPTLNWIGKENVINHHNEIEYNVLACKENFGEKNSGNLLVKGDNLLALKALLPYYANQIKMIYIDPPYNTGNTSWVYNDAVDSHIIKKWLHATVDKEDLSRTDKWLCMMYPRLKLLHKFLKEDGVIFISIDEAEINTLKLIMDEIFGSQNYATTLFWQSRTSKQNDTDISTNGEYILAYAKNRRLKDRRLKETNISSWFNDESFVFYPDEVDIKRYSNPDNDPRGPWKADPFDAPNIRENLTYEIVNPITKVKYLPPEGRCWRTEESSYDKLYEDERIIFGADGLGKPQLKVFYEEKKIFGEVPTTWLPGNDYGTTTSASKELKNIFGKKVFDYPKPVELIKHLLHLATKDGDIVLDSFAGSGSTAQAVLEQNQKDGFNRKFILIEMEEYAEEITANRIKKVIKGYEFTGTQKTELFKKKLGMAQILKPNIMEKLSIDIENTITEQTPNFDKISKSFKENTVTLIGQNNIKKFKKGIGGGFQYCELSEPLFDEYGLLNEKISHSTLAKHLYFTEFGQALNIQITNENYLGTINNVSLYLFSKEDFKKNNFNQIIKNNNQQSIVYADRTTISEYELSKHNITFKQLPFSIKDK
ncbi:hypothetical protein CP985_13285 [Malaciobacter mytili LMG 24559]|uniref:site-specific DNA-methyltransferase (adenine-specific) n=1 Tax=Malaciobacter mytili LMG 24559 TaxID=1032238 RepID=A0AAX2AE56_9BACT|nr:site-specific DNA-methyltransferase [Malaciobacter mytili]AXH16211.1 type III restriction/modification system, modification subunit [Malaciobacter mytili LMG 24559]RXK13688.1 hypothetical protein CP985_13285 [Malaciobacter mytili LMG 24559]